MENKEIALSEKTLADVLRDVWQARAYLIVFAVFGGVLAFGFIALAVPQYRAEMIIGPAQGFGQRAIEVPEGSLPVPPDALSGDAAFQRFEQSFVMPSVARVLLADEAVRRGIAQDRAFGFLSKKQKGEEDYFQRRVEVSPVAGTVFRRVRYWHPDAAFAVMLLGRVHATGDLRIREAVLQETQERIAYLNDALSRVQNPEHRRSLAGLLMEQERVKMMVSLDQPFAAAIVEPPYASVRPRWPDKFVIFPVFVFVGMLAGFAVYGFRRGGS